MKIIDSLLICNVFSLWRGAGEPLSFFHQAAHEVPISEVNATGHNLEPS
jgi:hypothetical protein